MVKNIFLDSASSNFLITYSNEIFIVKSLLKILIEMSVLIPPITQRSLFLIIDSAEKDRLLSQLLTAIY